MAQSGIGTTVFRLACGDVVIVPPEKIKDYVVPYGAGEVFGIKTISIDINTVDPIVATIEICSCIDVIEAIPRFFVFNPNTNKTEEVKKIEFVSGRKWNAK